MYVQEEMDSSKEGVIIFVYDPPAAKRIKDNDGSEDQRLDHSSALQPLPLSAESENCAG